MELWIRFSEQKFKILTDDRKFEELMNGLGFHETWYDKVLYIS